MPKLVLNDGTELEGAYAVVFDNKLSAYVPGKTLTEGYALLNDPEKTKVIRSEQYGTETVYNGYSHLYYLREEVGDLLTAGFRRAEE